jgi:hypothetical protein
LNKKEIQPRTVANLNDEPFDLEWQKKLKIKENILVLHFKEVLNTFKPKILT